MGDLSLIDFRLDLEERCAPAWECSLDCSKDGCPGVLRVCNWREDGARIVFRSGLFV